MHKSLKLISENQHQLLINYLSNSSNIEFDADSDDGRDILYDIYVNDKKSTNPFLEEVIREIHCNILNTQEGRGIIFIRGNKIILVWKLELHKESLDEINEIFYKELSNVLSIPKEWDMSALMKCYFEFNGEMKKRNRINFDKFIFTSHLYDYRDLLSDTSKREVKKFENGYVFNPNHHFQDEIKKMISKLISSYGLKENTFLISGCHNWTNFSVYPNESKTYELSLN